MSQLGDLPMEQVDANLNLSSQEVGWSWTRPLFQRCKATINGYVRCKHISEIFAKLREFNRIEEFGRSCFGHFVDFDWSSFSCNTALHDLVGQGITKTDSSSYELWFRIGDRNIRFSKYEFALVTGLRFGDSSFDPDVDHTPPADGVYARYIDGNITVDRLRVRFLRGDFGEFPADSLKVAMVLFVYYGLICKDGSKLLVDNWIWTLIEDTDRWENFPWGKYSFQMLLQHFRCLPETIRVAAKGERLPTYHFYGPSYALLVWMYEAIPSIGSVFGRREWPARVPRCTCWRFKKVLVDVSTYLSDHIDCLEMLVPSPIERIQRYWRHVDDDLRVGIQYVHRDTLRKSVDDVGASSQKRHKIGTISASGQGEDQRQDKHQSTTPPVAEPRYPRRRPVIGAPIDPSAGCSRDHPSVIQPPVSSHCPDTDPCTAPSTTRCQDQPPDSNIRTVPSTTCCEEQPSVWTKTPSTEQLRATIREEVNLVFERVFLPKVQSKFSDIVRTELTHLIPHLLEVLVVHPPIAGTTSFASARTLTADTTAHAPPLSTSGPDGSASIAGLTYCVEKQFSKEIKKPSKWLETGVLYSAGDEEVLNLIRKQCEFVADDLVSDGDQDIEHTSRVFLSATPKKGNSNCETSKKRHKVEYLLKSKPKDTATKSGGKSVDVTIKSEYQSQNLEGNGQVDYVKAYSRSKDAAAKISSHEGRQILRTEDMSIRDRLRSVRDAEGKLQHNLAIDGLPQWIPIPAGGSRLQQSAPSSSLYETPATGEPTEVEEIFKEKFVNSHSMFEVSDEDTYAQYIEELASSADGPSLAGKSYVEKIKLFSTYLAKATTVLSAVISDPRVSHSKGELETLRDELHTSRIREKQLCLSINKLTEEAEVARGRHESLENEIRVLEAGNKKRI